MREFYPNPIRTLANSNHWQTIYARCKEIGSLQLFDNRVDLSKFQLILLQWMEIYNSLYMDLSTKQDFISEDVIKDEIRTDAYLYYRKKRRENSLYNKQEEKK